MTISIVFLSNLHSTEALRLLEVVQLILQPAKVAQPLFQSWNFNLPKCWSVSQPLFWGGNFNLLKCWSVAWPLFWGWNYNLLKYCQLHSHSSKVFLSCNYNLLKYCQLHSHSSEVFLSCNYNLPKCWSIAQPLPISPPTHYRLTGGHLNFVLLANPLAHQSHCWLTGGHLNLPCWPTH